MQCCNKNVPAATCIRKKKEFDCNEDNNNTKSKNLKHQMELELAIPSLTCHWLTK